MSRRRLCRWIIGAGLVILVPVVLVAISFGLWFIDRSNRLEAGSQVIETANGTIEYAFAGDEDAPTVLSIHGVTGGYDFGIGVAEMLDLTDAGMRVLSISRPGYLRTPLADKLTPDDQADLYAALLDTLDIESVALLAVSGGGPSALAFANRYPDRVWGMVMAITITHQWELDDHVADITTFRELPPIVVDLALWYTEEIQLRFDRRGLVRQTILDNTRVDDATADALTERVMQHPDRLDHLRRSIRISVPMSDRLPGTFNDLDQQMALPLTPDYSAIRAPVLAFYGERDALVPLAHGAYLTEHLPNVEMHIDPEGGHAPFLHDSWTDTQTRIIEFLETHAP